jgi:hypothetical protein
MTARLTAESTTAVLLANLVEPSGIEPLTCGFSSHRSNRLSYSSNCILKVNKISITSIC